MSGELFVGLMSGTSLDGIDAVLVDFSGASPVVLRHVHHGFEPSLREALLELQAPGSDELERGAECANRLAHAYARAVAATRADAAVQAIGCHGQTVRHRPDSGYTLQLGNAALLAELTRNRVISDFRSRDVAAGGQGAPLVPAFHAAVFGNRSESRVVLNLGGIANLSWLPATGDVRGFDTGPGNCLMDLWASRHLGRPFDDRGAWAAGGRLDAALLDAMLAEPYFAKPPPKSTGRDLFNAAWLDRHLSSRVAPKDVQSTLLQLTTTSAAEAIRRHCAGAARLIACGGGVANAHLMQSLAEALAPLPVESSARFGLEPTAVEASAFAWLAREALAGRPGNVPSVTGARGPRVLGAIYPP
ncbi:MAG: anhydro-N-acetylmuramic acid kinase [Burkholderiales bacterium]